MAGPAAGTILADFGARVIKIEPPGSGDGYRKLRHLPGVPVGDTNYPPGVRENLRLRYSDISAVNPKTIYATLTAYGETGPEADSTG
ncbi:MAG: CoA transferase [Halioglobus sp.]|nr:CoA transferase [Halioglobus sp.]